MVSVFASDDPASWSPSPAVVGWLDVETPTEVVEMPTAWPAVEPDTGDPVEWITAWRESEECPVLLTLLGELYGTAQEEVAA